MRFFISRALIISSFFCGLNLVSKPNDNLLYKSTASFPARPVGTLPCVENNLLSGRSISATAFIGSTLPLQDANKRVFDTTLRKEALDSLFEVLKNGAFFDPGDEKTASAFKEIIDIFGKFTTESHRLGAVLKGSWAIGPRDEVDASKLANISISLPIMASIAHFFIPSEDVNQIKKLLGQITTAMVTEDPTVNVGFLDELKNTPDLKEIVHKKFGPTDLRVDIVSPRYEQEKLGIKVGLEGVVALDKPTREVGPHIGINRDWLIESTITGNFEKDLEEMVGSMVVGEGLPAVSMLSALVRSQVKPQLDSWGYAFGPVIDFDLDVIPEIAMLFAKLRTNLYFGKTRRSIIIVDDFYQPSEFTVQTYPSVMTQLSVGALFSKRGWDLKLGYDFLHRTKERIRSVFDAYRDVDAIDYFANNRLQLDAAAVPSIYQHRLFANLEKAFGAEESVVVSIGADGAFCSKFMPKNLNFSFGCGYIF